MKINGLSKEVESILKDYAGNCTEIIQEATEEVAKKAVKELKRTSPKNTGKYSKSWKQKTEKSRVGGSAVVYNEKYQLTHLLENGHANRNGGRTEGKPHIAPVNDSVQDELIEVIEQKIGNLK